MHIYTYKHMWGWGVDHRDAAVREALQGLPGSVPPETLHPEP